MNIKFKKKYIILTILLILVFFIVFSMLSGRSNPYEGKISKVKLGTIEDILEEKGTVFSKRVNIFYSDMSQRVEVLNVSVGDKVKTGDIILTYDNDYDLEIERANKQIEVITATYNENVKGADFQQISNMKLNISTIENNLILAKNNLDKTKNLYENQAVSEVEYKEAENNVITIENQLQEAKNNYDLMMQDVSSNVKKQYEAQIGEILIQIKLLEERIEKSSIKAEFDGVITELNVQQGGMTKIGVPVVEIQDDKNLGVFVEVLTDDAARIVNGMPFIIKDNKGNKEFKVNRIYPKAESTVSDLGVEQKRVRVEADLNGEITYKIGTEIDVVIILEKKSDVLLVNRNAVYDKSQKEYVTALEDNKEIEKEITTGLKNDNYIEITSGLIENEVVLIE